MRLFEFEAKKLLRQRGLATPVGEVASTAEKAFETAEKLRPSYVVKSQVLVGGRGKAGGIRFAPTPENVKEATEELLQSQIRGFTIEKVLVEERIQAERELYLAVALERAERSYVIVVSSRGGVDIETTAVEKPDSIVRLLANPDSELSLSAAKKTATALGLSEKQQDDFTMIMKDLFQIALELDAVLIEINPLALTSGGSFVALDSRIIIDDNALFRHPDLEKLRFERGREYSEQEIEAAKKGIIYVKLSGEIGIIGNGAGLVMATLDMVQAYGRKPANFLDLGGGAQSEKIAFAVSLLMSDPSVDVILINILGGLTLCDDVARAIVDAKNIFQQKKPIFSRLTGTNEAEGKRILLQAGLPVFESMEVTVKHAVQAVKSKIG